MTPEQRRVLAALRDGATLVGKSGRHPILRVAGKRPEAIKAPIAQPLWDDRLLDFKRPFAAGVFELILTEKGRRALAEAEGKHG